MTPEEVQARVDAIRAMAGDDEAAHSEEDQLYEDVLKAIAAGTIVDGMTCARLALTTRDIEFTRWCA